MYNPPIKGQFIKKKKVLPKVLDLTGTIEDVKKLTAHVDEVQSDIDETLNAFADSIKENFEIFNKNFDETGKTLDELSTFATTLQDTILDAFDKVSASISKLQGSIPNEEELLIKLLSKIPPQEKINVEKLTENILHQVPKYKQLDESKIVSSILKALPEKKGQLKVITEHVEIDPISVIDKIMALPQEIRNRFRLGTTNIDGLDQTISAFNSQISKRGYLHGGGISKEASIASMQPFELSFPWKLGYNLYLEKTKTGGRLSKIDYWASSAKTKKLFTKNFYRIGGKLSSIVEVDEITGKTLTKTFDPLGVYIDKVIV